MITYIDDHKASHGVEPICRVLEIAPSTYHAAKRRPPSARAIADAHLAGEVARVHADNLSVYGVRLYRDEPWAFDPQAVVGRPLRELADALRRYRVSQRHVIDAFGWRIVAETLADPSLALGVQTVVFEGRGDAAVLLSELALASKDGCTFCERASRRMPISPLCAECRFGGGAGGANA